MWFRKSGFCRQNVEWNADGSYLASGLLCKRGCNLLEGPARKPPALEAPDQRRSDARACNQAPCPIEFRLEGGDGAGCRVGRDKPPLKICSDSGVAIPAPGEALRTGLGHAGVVQ